MPQQLNLAIERRDNVGTSKVRALRRAGKVPGVIYGHGSEAQSVAFESRALQELLRGGGRTSLVTLTMNGRRFDTALVREIQIDPVSRRIIHVDLQRVSADESVNAKLPVVTTGTAAGVREFGGVMDVLTYELEVEGPANKLPDHLEVDVSNLGIHEHVTAGEVKLPDGFKLLTGSETVVVTVEPSRTERELEEAAVAPVPEQAEPELVGKTEEPLGAGE